MERFSQNLFTGHFFGLHVNHEISLVIINTIYDLKHFLLHTIQLLQIPCNGNEPLTEQCSRSYLRGKLYCTEFTKLHTYTYENVQLLLYVCHFSMSIIKGRLFLWYEDSL